MDLDLLSSRWQQQSPAPQSADALRALLTSRPKTPLTQMRHNLWVEIGTTLVMAALLLAVLYGIRSTYLGRLLALLLPLYGGIGCCYLRMAQVLRGLRNATGALAGHIAGQLQQLRQLTRLYYGSTMLSTLAIMGLLSYLAIQYVRPHVPAAGQMQFLVWVMLTALVTLGVTHWFTRYHIQNFYGQHLDRLENVLHELHKDEE